jgi:hypothetical protein
MSKATTEKLPEPLTAEEVVTALSYHGAFLKKHVLATIRATSGVHIVNEEFAESASLHRTAPESFLIARTTRK